MADTGATAIAARNVSMGALGVTNPRTWWAGDRLWDLAPHSAYGAVA